MKIEQFKFLTTNEQKARDFKNAGFAVENNPNEVSEILSDNVELVALYKAFDTNVENSIVEDTCLNIENSYFLGTQIKDYWQELEKDSSFHMKKATWIVSLCLQHKNNFYISTEKTDGILMYPALEHGYHFNKIFTVLNNGKQEYFEHLSFQDKKKFSPRVKAIEKLKKSLLLNDFSIINTYDKHKIVKWIGEYQYQKPIRKKL